MSTSELSLPCVAAELRAEGRKARDYVSRGSHGAWSAATDRPSPIDTLAHDDVGRMTELLPIRYGRMSASPFAFYRGSASIMANDLQSTPSSGLYVPIAGDAHLSNFGCYATPERRLVFDVNDFDESFVGPWEWDLKRLATSVTIAARHLELRRNETREATLECVRSYTDRMREFAGLRQLSVWYAAIDEDRLAGLVARTSASAKSHVSARDDHAEHHLPKLTGLGTSSPAIADSPPLIFHAEDRAGFLDETRRLYEGFVETMPSDRRELLGRFRLVDAAYKVVGVGSVGTRCLIALLMADAEDPLVLQIKEARSSVFERYAVEPGEAAHGERVVEGQRLLQARSDMFLGWAHSQSGFCYYVRRLADWKAAIEIDHMSADDLARYGSLCGWALARAHARASGRAAWIAGYLGRGEAFANALERFADAYADRNEADYETLIAAIRSGRIAVATA